MEHCKYSKLIASILKGFSLLMITIGMIATVVGFINLITYSGTTQDCCPNISRIDYMIYTLLIITFGVLGIDKKDLEEQLDKETKNEETIDV